MSDKAVRCPACRDAGLTSQVRVGGTQTTLLSPSWFYDEAGVRHIHDCNAVSTAMTCTSGHVFDLVTYSECQCGWRHAADYVAVVTPFEKG